MKKILILALIVLIFGIAAYLFIFHKPHKNTFNLKAEYTISADELLNEFETDENNANSKYLGKIIQLEGEIVTVKNISESYEISFIDELFGVTCMVDSVYAVQQTEKLKQLKAGDNVTIKGQCNGYLTDVKLDRCVVL
jgi:tRNA_anti-like